MNIVLIGFMGSGKTSVGRLLARKLGSNFVDLDERIEEASGVKIAEIFASGGEGHFRELESRETAGVSVEDGLVISTGGGVVLNQDNIINLKKNGRIVFLRTRPETVLKRIVHDRSRPLLQKDDKEAAVRRLMDERMSLYEEAGDVIIDTDELNKYEVVDLIINMIKEI